MRALSVLLGLLALFAVMQVDAAPRETATPLAGAEKALAAKDYALAYREYEKHATHDATAQFALGMFEREGWGRKANPVAACRWFDKAAQAKVPAAEEFLGDCFAYGIDRHVDGNAAVQWYLKAAGAGIFPALCSAGALYIAGRAVEKNVAQGIALCTQAAQAGSPAAMLQLGDYYREGTAVPQDFAAARYWYRQAAEIHNVEAQYRLGIMFNQGEGGPADPQAALTWLELAASEGYSPAYLPVAVLYANAAPDPKTGKLAPDVLAKIYMWNSAAKLSVTDPGQRAEVARIEALTLAVMPAQWRPDLDRRVAAHLAQFAPR